MRSKSVLLRSSFLALLLLLSPGCSRPDPRYREWRAYLGDPGRSHYSSLHQINRRNVHKLAVAWVYHSGDPRPNNRSQIQCNPIVVHGVLYATSPQLKVIALDAAAGRMIWTFDPFQEVEENRQGVNRGVTYWQEGEDQRIFFSASHYLFALEARTGRPIQGFGNQGRIDLRDGLDRDIGELYIASRTPGAVYQDLIILPTVVDEGPGRAAPGHIRAFDVRTGRVRWIFHTLPQPGEFGSETWPPDAWKTIGGANCWAGLSVDEERGMVFIPTGSASFDFWGGNRLGQNLFANCILALKAESGERVWHFQTVHHDLWDRDLPAPPNLVTLRRAGRRIDALAQITKSGHIFIFNRDSGEPLFPVEERPVPSSDLKGEETWPTQPFPLQPPPFARQSFTEADLSDISPETNAYLKERLKGARTGRPFIPPSTDGTVIFPGFDGGGEWGGAAWDPETGILYVNSNEMPWILTMVDVTTREKEEATPGAKVYAVHCAVCHGAGMEGDPQKAPSLDHIEQRIPSRRETLRIIRNGAGSMLGFAHLSEAEMEALLNFLYRTERSRRTPHWAVPPPEIPYSHRGYTRFLDKDGYPAVKPPWGSLNAIDLNTGKILWQVPFGEFPELRARGIPQTGTENYGGPVVTAGGLIFIGATKDEKFRAFDKRSGKVLWETTLPAGGYATPCTYEVNGKQYVVIAAGGGKMGTRSGDAYVAFALPD